MRGPGIQIRAGRDGGRGPSAMRAAGGSPGPSGRASITTRSVALVVAGGVIAGESAFLGAKSATRRTTGPVGQLQDVMHEHREEIEALKRMQRDAFHELLLIKSQGAPAPGGVGRTQTSPAVVSADLSLAHGLQPWDPERQGEPPFASEEGLDMGYEVRVRAEVGDRARGPLYAAVQAAGSFLQPAFQVDKILIRASLRRGWDLFVAPRGCRASDAVPTLNPAEGLGLTELTREGCTAHQLAEGPGAAIQIQARADVRGLGPTVVSLAAHTRARDAPLSGLVQSVLAQACVAPRPWVSMSAVAMAQRLDTAGGSQELGRQMLPLLGALAAAAARPRSQGGATEALSLVRTRIGGAFAAVVGRGGAQVNGWVLACGNHLRPGRSLADSVEWGLKLTRPVVDGGVMVAAIGRRRPSAACMDQVMADDRPDRWTAEVSVTQPLRDGLTLTPGIVATQSEKGTALTVALGWKWTFL